MTYIKVGEGEWICGPIPAYYRAAASKSELEHHRSSPFDKTGVERFQIVRLPDPSTGFAVLTPPRVHSFKPFAVGGVCAAATVVSWRLDQILPGRTASSLVRSVRLRCNEDEPMDYEVEFSPDLLTVTEYEGYPQTRPSEELVWRTRPIWWKDGKYKEGLWEDSPPPVSSTWRRNPH